MLMLVLNWAFGCLTLHGNVHKLKTVKIEVVCVAQWYRGVAGTRSGEEL